MYTVGAVVDGFELTTSGEWVRRSPTAGSPYRLGDVVDEHLLDADLSWVRLRHAPTEPYRAGDVVDGYVLVPDGSWVPLTSRVRPRAGGPSPRRTTDAADTRTGPSAAERAERRAQEQRLATERAAADRRAASQAASAEQRSADRRTADAQAAARRAAERTATARAAGPSSAPSSTAPRPQYRVGDVVNGHVLTPDMRWVPLAAPTAASRASSGARPQQQGRRSGIPPIVPLVVVGFFLLQALRACAG